jgi:RNA polymerase sigma-70 factor (ECF subfamily)
VTAIGRPDEKSDGDLLAAHAGGDPQAFSELVRRHRDRMWAVALRTLRDPDEAADALQEAFISAFRAAGAFRGQSQVTTWLHRIVVNACLDRMRRPRAGTRSPIGRRNSPSATRSPSSRPTSGPRWYWSTCRVTR